MVPDARPTPDRPHLPPDPPHLPPDPALVADQLNNAARQLSQLVAATKDPAAVAVGRWTARDLAAHIAAGLELYTVLVRGGTSPADTIDAIAEVNDDLIAAVGTASMPMLADRIRASTNDYLMAIETRPAGSTAAWHAGLNLPVTTLAAISLGEMLVHGHDLAAMTGAPWPVPDAWARTVFHGVMPVLPYYLRPDRAAGRTMRVDVRLRGRGHDRTLFAIADAALRIGSPDGAPIDCHISAQPWAMVQCLYSRLRPMRAAVTGRISAWGRRPWLAFQLASLFRNP